MKQFEGNRSIHRLGSRLFSSLMGSPVDFIYIKKCVATHARVFGQTETDAGRRRDGHPILLFGHGEQQWVRLKPVA